MSAVHDQQRRAQPRGRGECCVHQVDQAPDRVDARLLDHQRVAPQRAQHRDVVRSLDMEALAGQCQTGHQPHTQPQRQPRHETPSSSGPTPPVRSGSPRRHRGSGCRSRRSSRRRRPPRPCSRRAGRAARPGTAARRMPQAAAASAASAARPGHSPRSGAAAKAALVVGVGGDAVSRPIRSPAFERRCCSR